MTRKNPLRPSDLAKRAGPVLHRDLLRAAVGQVVRTGVVGVNGQLVVAVQEKDRAVDVVVLWTKEHENPFDLLHIFLKCQMFKADPKVSL